MTLLEIVQPVAEAATTLHTHAAVVAQLVEAPVAQAAEILRAWDAPNPAPKAPPGSGGLVAFLGGLKYVALVVGVIGLVVVGLTFAISKGRGEGHEISPTLMKWLLGISIAGSASLIVSWITAAAGF
ncbi:hypothetical protein AB3K78_01295 [Leucobacter sp. HNU]|uniref:hypothetical protein n=1 Tax=Leucobacter sp. HNU TaxID=3236805 RepID=UPI003A7FC4F2